MNLKTVLCIGFTATALTMLPGLASAKGCLKGAAVGGVGGHVAGHHGLLGAVAGCAVGHHIANKPAKTAPNTPAPQSMPQPTSPTPAKT